MKLEETCMRKRISVCMLAAMMSVTSMYSFVAQGAENETEQETGIEQESEESQTQAEEAVDPMSADRLLMRARDFRPSEILDAYFGEGKWDEALVTNQDSLASERNEYDGEDRTVLIVQSGIGFLAISITYKNEVPDEEIRRQEGEDLLQALNIDITDEYIKQTEQDKCSQCIPYMSGGRRKQGNPHTDHFIDHHARRVFAPRCLQAVSSPDTGKCKYQNQCYCQPQKAGT